MKPCNKKGQFIKKQKCLLPRDSKGRFIKRKQEDWFDTGEFIK